MQLAKQPVKGDRSKLLELEKVGSTTSVRVLRMVVGAMMRER